MSKPVIDTSVLDFESEKYAVRNFLENIYGLFSALMETGDIILTDDKKIPTACIARCPVTKDLTFHFNKELWEKSTTYDRAFIICHEMLHVFLKHFSRLPENVILPLYNIATDISINHMLCNLYGFDRDLLDSWKKWCWVETVFPDNLYDNDLSSDIYYKLLIDGLEKSDSSEESDSSEGGDSTELPGDGTSKGKSGSKPGKGKNLIGGHGYSPYPQEEGGPSPEDQLAEAIEEFISENFEEITIEDVAESVSRGTMPGSLTATMKKIKVVKKKKWETLIREKTLKYITDSDNEQWARLSRRSYLLPTDLFIPSDQEIEDTDKEKTEVWFFLDTSGSCLGFAERFWKAALSLDPKYFVPKLLCFDTKVYEVDIKTRKLYGFGGTSFVCMEKFIQDWIKKNNSKYPKLIFVITDGYGDYIKPENPKVWNWFLTPGGSTYCLPKTSNIHNLKDFE